MPAGKITCSLSPVRRGTSAPAAKVYEADPLECSKCKGSMRVIALIEDAGVIRRILEHLGVLSPAERSPPLDPASWPAYASLPLTYHPVPDVA